jgi:hypothetical protein
MAYLDTIGTRAPGTAESLGMIAKIKLILPGSGVFMTAIRAPVI